MEKAEGKKGKRGVVQVAGLTQLGSYLDVAVESRKNMWEGEFLLPELDWPYPHRIRCAFRSRQLVCGDDDWG
jgi:hypothetical protein